MASPSAAQRVLSDVQRTGGVGRDVLGFTTRPASLAPRPYAVPASTMVRASSPALAASRVMLRKPGPATSTCWTPGTCPKRVASRSATTRGGIPAPLAT